MKNILKLSAIVAIFFAEPAMAGHSDADKSHNHAQEASGVQSTSVNTNDASCENKIDVKVNGLICDFCARALEKVFSKRQEVKGIDVDLDNGNVTIAMQPGKTLDDATITQLITDSGYNVTNIHKGC